MLRRVEPGLEIWNLILSNRKTKKKSSTFCLKQIFFFFSFFCLFSFFFSYHFLLCALFSASSSHLFTLSTPGHPIRFNVKKHIHKKKKSISEIKKYKRWLGHREKFIFKKMGSTQFCVMTAFKIERVFWFIWNKTK